MDVEYSCLNSKSTKERCSFYLILGNQLTLPSKPVGVHHHDVVEWHSPFYQANIISQVVNYNNDILRSTVCFDADL